MLKTTIISLLIVFSVLVVCSCYLPPKYEKGKAVALLGNIKKGRDIIVKDFKFKYDDPRTLMEHLENFNKFFRITAPHMAIKKEKSPDKYKNNKQYMEYEVKNIILEQIHEALDEVRTSISKGEYEEATDCLFSLILNLLVHIMREHKDKNIVEIDIIKSVTSLVDRLKNPDSGDNNDTFNIMEELFNVFLAERISLKDILIGSPATVEKLQDSKSNEFLATLGENFDDYRKNLPVIIKLMYLKSMGENGLGKGIPKASKPWDEDIKLKEDDDAISLSPAFTLDSESEYTVNANEYAKYLKNKDYITVLSDPDLLLELKKILPPQGFSSKKTHPSNKTKILDTKQCGILAIIKMLTIDYNKQLGPSFIDKLLDDYVSRKNKINWEDVVKNLLDDSEKDTIEDKTLDVLADTIESLVSIKGPLKEVGLLPKDMVDTYKKLGVKMVSSKNFESIFNMMKKCMDKGLSVCPLLYWGDNDETRGGMHYRPYMIYKEDVMVYDESTHHVNEDDKQRLKYLMSFKESSITNMINPKSNAKKTNPVGGETNKDQKKDSGLDSKGIMESILGSEGPTRVEKAIREVIKDKTKLNKKDDGKIKDNEENEENSGIPFCFITIDKKNDVISKIDDKPKDVLIYDGEKVF